MPECEYCSAHVEGEEAYLEHLRAEHADELGRIDRRRVASGDDGDGGLPVVPIAIAVLLFVGVGLVGYAMTSGGSGDSGSGPGPVERAAHGHGTINMTVLGERVDFSRPAYQLQADEFHFENGDGRIWHVHARGVTLQWAMGTLGIEVTGDSVTYEGTTYEDGDGYDVRVAVDGEPVDPGEYVLEGVSVEEVRAGGGPHVEIVVSEA